LQIMSTFLPPPIVTMTTEENMDINE
jgi:hypothetical protein